MKKLSVFALAALLVAMFSVPAMAIEHEFGGYFRTRFIAQDGFGVGEDAAIIEVTEVTDPVTGAVTTFSEVVGNTNQDLSQVDTRTRLYYTAKFSDNFKFINKFEFDAVWGEAPSKGGYGDIGADGVKVEIKNSYADFNLGMANFRVGVQGFLLGSGFIMDDDGAGITILASPSEKLTLGAVWVRHNEGGPGKDLAGEDNNDGDVDAIVLVPTMMLAEGMTLKGEVGYFFSDNAGAYERLPSTELTDLALWYLGLNFQGSAGPLSYGVEGYLQGGDVDLAGDDTVDFKGYLVSANLGYDLGGADVHGQFTYATGDDTPDDTDFDAFFNPPGASYYWAEILGYGIFDQQTPSFAPADQISNVMFFNLGAGFKPMEKLKLKADLWYANAAEEDVFGNDDMGVELDLVATYALLDGLNLDLVGAYLWAGDYLAYDGNADNDPWELGARLSLSF
ncbi:MAG: alginate export family protein [Desulfobacterales bacterium]